MKFLLLSVLLLAGCQSVDYSQLDDFLPRRLSGQINGRDWEYVYAYVHPTAETPNEDDYVFMFLPYKPDKKCPDRSVGKDDRAVMISVAKEVKSFRLKRGTTRTLVFSSFTNGKPWASVAIRGKVKLIAVANNSIKGMLYGYLNDANYVNGAFIAVNCEIGELQ
jgi:hypothetical protein